MKKDNYKINFNKQVPSSADIKKHQNFDGLMAEYEHSQSDAPSPRADRKPRRIWRRLAVAAAAAVGLLVLAIGFGRGKKNKAMAGNAPYVNPPMESTVAEEVLTSTVAANRGGRIVFKSGTVAVVPPRAFANRAGEVVAGEVEIKIKEYHDYIDFFLSGIPMQYDSLGTMYQLESAGMIEIYAEQDGERLDLMPEKSIDIELKSTVQVKPGSAVPNFNIYKLNEDKENWEYVTRDKMSFIGEEPSRDHGEDSHEPLTIEGLESNKQKALRALDQTLVRELSAFENSIPLPVKPQRPEKANTNNPTFELKLDDRVVQNNISEEEASLQKSEAELRELQKKYDKFIWEVLPGQATWSSAIATTDWDDREIRANGNNQYTVTFIKGESRVDVNVKPVLVGKYYSAALEKFEQEFAAYTAVTTERQAKIDIKKAELEKIKAARAAVSEAEFDERIAEMKAAGLDRAASNEMIKREVLNSFNVTSFGIWNCDRPLPAYAAMLKGKFTDQFDSEYNGLTAFRADRSRNTVAKFTVGEGIQVQYNENSDNLMWFVTPENKIAVYRPQDFKKIKKKRGDFTFVMDLEEQTIDSEDDIRKILDFD